MKKQDAALIKAVKRLMVDMKSDNQDTKDVDYLFDFSDCRK